MTGEIPASFTPSNFRNAYPIIGFCGIDPTTTPVRYRIHEERKDAEQFSIEVETAVAIGFLKGGDVLVLDNAAIHTGKENSVLEDWLWDNFGIFVLFLPTRSPEWNPVEQVWKILVRRLKTYPLAVLKTIGAHSAAYAASHILSEITHEEVYNMYRHCEIVD